MTVRVINAALIPVGFQLMSLSNSTSVAINSTGRDASVFHISVETQAVRYRADGTNPTLTTGVLLAVGSHWINGFNGTSTMRFQRSTGTSKVSIMAYREAGVSR